MQFIFEHNMDALLPFLLETGRHVQAVLPARDDGGQLLGQCKFILTELCTNGIKHSGLPQSIFDIFVEDNHLVIEKKENGQPFCAITQTRERLLLPDDVTGCITLTEDSLNRIRVQRINEQSVLFFAEDTPLNPADDGPGLNEHFGLIIICRSCNRFIYTRSPDGTNIFTVYIKIA